MTTAVHMIVEGLVQGVGFRWFVARRAQELGLTGYVRNLVDGNVEIEAVGDRSLLEELIGIVKVGPRSSQVTNMHIRWTSPSRSYTNFDIR